MRRALLPFVSSLAVAMILSAAPALGAADDDIPGSPLGAETISNSVNPGSDANDVFSISVASGQEIRVECTTKAGQVAKGTLRLLIPSTPSLAAAAGSSTTYSLVTYSMSSYTTLYGVADFT